MIKQETVHQFMVLCGQTETGYSSQSDLYLKLINEEGNELINGIKHNNIVEIADGIINTIVLSLAMLYTIQTPEYIDNTYNWEIIVNNQMEMPIGYNVIKNPINTFEYDLKFINQDYKNWSKNINVPDDCVGAAKDFYDMLLEDTYYLIENCLVYGDFLKINIEEKFKTLTLENFKNLIGE